MTNTLEQDLVQSCAQFLYHEAALLDDNDHETWLEQCISQDIEYLVPIRTTRQRGVPEFNPTSYHINDRYAGLQVRVNRMLTEHAWAEDPPSRTRRFVTNVQAHAVSDDEAAVKSNLLIHRSQWDTPQHDLLAAGREDTLRREGGAWRLRSRLVLLNHTILPTANLGIFL